MKRFMAFLTLVFFTVVALPILCISVIGISYVADDIPVIFHRLINAIIE